MPESFSSKHCPAYHQGRINREIEEIGQAESQISKDVYTFHVPGHSPDSLAVLAGGGALLTGDTVLPEITPIPTRESFFGLVSQVLAPEYTGARNTFGLRTYIRSLKKLKRLGQGSPGLMVLPGHRLFYNNHWNEMDLSRRVDELLEHHLERCSDILRILGQGPKTAREIAEGHFEAHLLKGFGIMMGENEMHSHLELLAAAGDVEPCGDERFAATGGTKFEELIQSLEAAE